MSKLTDQEWVKLINLAVNYVNEHSNMRLGQSYMNALHVVNKEIYHEVAVTENDPFYDDKKIINFIKFLND